MTVHDILQYYIKSKAVGLFHGKMGASIAAFVLSEKYSSKDIAETLLSDTISKISDNMPLNIPEGLTGIGLGVNYLLCNNYVEGKPDNVLSEIDDIIFKRTAYIGHGSSIDFIEISDVLYYLIVRLKTGMKDRMNRAIFIELTKKLFNLLYMERKMDFFEEPLPYTIYYILARFLNISAEMHALKVYPFRIEQIWKEMKPVVFSKVPYLSCNRFHLINSVQKVASENKDEDWQKYLDTLCASYSFDAMLEKEIGHNQLFLTDGIVGICLIGFGFVKEGGYSVLSTADISKTLALIDNSELYQSYISKKICSDDRIGLDGMLGLYLLNHKLNESRL